MKSVGRVLSVGVQSPSNTIFVNVGQEIDCFLSRTNSVY